MKHFNELTPAEAERLAMLAEEAGEVIQIVGKILRHGYRSTHPSRPHGDDNRAMLGKELRDLLSVWRQMGLKLDVVYGLTGIELDETWEKKLPYTHHQSPHPQEAGK